MDLRLARLQGVGNLGHRHQIEIDSDRIEDDHQKTAQQENTHGCSITEWPASTCLTTETGGQSGRGQGGNERSNEHDNEQGRNGRTIWATPSCT